ncbi:MAG: class I SAM-dependent methyltransferase [Actinobacteria bacterium]|nr:class I SAM-dependent methyltransferase [Actinomycetota bacterium]
MTSPLVELLDESRTLGFLGPGPVEAHVRHADAFARAVDVPPARALDLGAGGGLPGLVLAATHWPTTRWTFLDAQQKRTAFLERAVGRLGLDGRVTVCAGRAEEVARDPAHRGGYDLVTARSFGAPAVTAECAAPLLRSGGTLVVSEPPQAELSDRWPVAGVTALGFGPAAALVVDGDPPVHLVRLVRVGPLDERVPRRVGLPSKRPLF